MSGGQRQRIAIARSIIKQPSILILDEATSSIDVRGEKIVQEALERVCRGRTTIVIAHRLSTISNADHIIVMNAGKNIEEGSHEELTSKDGMYHSFVRAQQLEKSVEPQGDAADDDAYSQKEEPSSPEDTYDDDEIAYGDHGTKKRKRFRVFRVLRVFIYEQRSHWFLYILTIAGALGAGCEYLQLPSPGLY